MQLADIVETHAQLAATRSRKAKTSGLAACLEQLDGDDVAIGVSYLCGELPQGRIGLGPAAVDKILVQPAARTSLTLAHTDRSFSDLAAVSGSGSQTARSERLAALFARATYEEQAFLRKLILGELRQGALEGLMTEAVAQAGKLPVAAVRKAVMLRGAIAPVAERALLDGVTGLATFRFELFRPVQAMLAQPADSATDALAVLGECALEYKLDGARVQVHRDGDAVRVFTRQLHDVTARVPEIVAAVSALPVEQLVLDGEAVALASDGRPLPFQATMQRFGRRTATDEARRERPLTAQFFDCIYVDGEDLLNAPGRQRDAVLADILPADRRTQRCVTAAPATAEAFLARAIRAGHEGIMAKSLDATYQAGNRGADWLKIKPTHTLDLVILAAEWGSGRRTGKLSNLHLGARDAANGTFVMLGKTFKGLTDSMLAWQTDALLAREIGREGNTVHVRPEVVVEVAFNELQRSSQYPGGLALRFARVKRYREDKNACDADTIETVRGIFAHGLAATLQ